MVAQRAVILVRETIEELRERGQLERAEAVASVLDVALARPGAQPAIEGYLTTGQAGKLAGVSAQTIKNWVAAGHVVAKRLGGRIMVDRSSLTAHIESQLGTAPPRQAPWEALTREQSRRLLRLAEAASPPEKLARYEALNEKVAAGQRLTAAERAEMTRLALEVTTAASDALERLIAAEPQP